MTYFYAFSFVSPSKELMVFSKSIFKMCVSPSLAGTLSFECFSLDDLNFCLSTFKFRLVSNKGIFYFTLSASGNRLSDIWIPIHLYFFFLTAYCYTVRFPRDFLSEVLSKWWCKVSKKAIWERTRTSTPRSEQCMSFMNCLSQTTNKWAKFTHRNWQNSVT